MRKNYGKSLIAVITAGVLTAAMTVSAFADTAQIKGDSIRVRSSASTSSSVVTTASSGTEYTILETTTDADGATWYKVKVSDSSTGYVRGDLVTVKSDSTTTNNDSPSTATSLAPTTPTAIAETTATVGGNSSVNTRSGAGKAYELVAKLDPGTSITLVGEAKDSEGNKWYQFKCSAKGITDGYIRSDLVVVSDTPAAEPVADESVEGEDLITEEGLDDTYTEEADSTGYIEGSLDDEAPLSENNDYEIVYTTDDEGNYQYYLYNHIDNTRQKVEDLLGAISTLNTNYSEVEGKLTLFKVLTIIFGVLVLVLIGLLVFLILRNREVDDYYDDDDDDEDEDDIVIHERPAARKPVRRKPEFENDGNEELEENERRVRREPARAPRSEANVQERKTSSREMVRAEREEALERSNRRPRKAQNFLADDDEFEFEFLNMDDKG